MGVLGKLFQVVYNLAQLALWIGIAADLYASVSSQNIDWAQKGIQGLWAINFRATYEAYADKLVIAQALSVVEVLQPLLGITKGSVGAALVQVLGRSHIVLIVHSLVPDLRASVLMFLTIIAWTSIELVRYPYYILNVFGVSFYPLTWLRYTLWIPLYPTGMTTETGILWYAREAAGKTGLFSHGVDAYFWALTAYLGLAFVVMPGQLRHMWKQRGQYLNPRPQEKKDDKKKTH